MFKEFTVYGETEDQDSHTLRRWASKGPGLARHYLQVQLHPEEGASPLPTTFSCNKNAARETGTPANGQLYIQPLDDWEFPALLPTPKKAAKAATRDPLHLYKPYESMWCTECEHNVVCFGKQQGSGLCQSCFDKNVARAAAAKAMAKIGSTQAAGDPANLLRNRWFGSGVTARIGSGRGGRGFGPLPTSGR